MFVTQFNNIKRKLLNTNNSATMVPAISTLATSASATRPLESSSSQDIVISSVASPSDDIAEPDVVIESVEGLSIDIFQISSQTTLDIDESDPLKEMKKAINLLLHPQIITNMEKFQNELNRLNEIEMDGEIKWSLQGVLGAHESTVNQEKNKANSEALEEAEAKRKTDFERVKKEFLEFPDDANAALKRQKLFGLEQSIMHAAFPILERNYRYDHKKYVYLIDGKRARKKIARNGEVFSITCEVLIYWLNDGLQVVNNSYSNVKEGISVQDNFLALDKNGKLQARSMPHSEHEFSKICSIIVTGEVDLDGFCLEQNSINARFRIEIVSERKEFNYYGLLNDPTVLQIQSKPVIECYDFTIFPELGIKINHFLFKKNMEMENVTKEICSLKDKIEANSGELGTIFSIQKIDSAKKELMKKLLKLFDLATNKNAMQRVVDLFCADLINNFSEDAQIKFQIQREKILDPTNKERFKQAALLFNDNALGLQQYFHRQQYNNGIVTPFLQFISSILEKSKEMNFASVLEQTIAELVIFFDELGEGRLIEIYLTLKMNFVYELNYSAIYVEKNAERFKLDTGRAVDDRLAPIVQQEASATTQKITAIDYALNKVLKKRGFKIIYPGNKATVKAGGKNDEEIEQPNEFLYAHLRETVKQSVKNKLSRHIYSDLVQFHQALKKQLHLNVIQSLEPNKVHIRVGKQSEIKDISHQFSVVEGQNNDQLVALIDVRKRGDYFNIFNNAEKIAILMERGPFLKGINEGLLMHYIIDLALSSYPIVRQDAQKYLIIADIIGGLVGTLIIGRYAILNPSKPLNKSIVRWETLTRGLTLLVFTMFDSVLIYRNYFNNDEECPDRLHCQMSDKMFWTTIFFPSSLFALANVASDLAFASQYLTYGQVHNLKYRFAKWLSNSFYNSLLQQTFLLKVVGLDKTNYEVDTFIPTLIMGFLLATLQEVFLRKKFNNYVPVLMALVSACTFLGIWYRQSEGQKQQGINPLAPAECARIAFWSLLFMYQAWFIRRNHTEFVRNYTGDFIQIIKVEPPKLPTKKRSNSIDLSYQALPDNSEDGNNHSQSEVLANSSSSFRSSQLDFSILTGAFFHQSGNNSDHDNDEEDEKKHTAPTTPPLLLSQSGGTAGKANDLLTNIVQDPQENDLLTNKRIPRRGKRTDLIH